MILSDNETKVDLLNNEAIAIKVHPVIQGNLLDFLESLPYNRLGPWVCAGWGDVITETHAKQRFDRLLEIWSESGGQLLKATAKATLSTRQKGGR